MRVPAVLLATVLLGSSAAAQTTHNVNLFTQSFSPSNLTIEVGDTVRWTWVAGFHDVVSAPWSTGLPNGYFSSGIPTATPGTTFEVLFDQAFLDTNPEPGNVYQYVCSIHYGVNMFGRVTVEIPAEETVYGCGTNPAGSMTIQGGSAAIGGTLLLGVDNPLGTQAAGSIALVFVANAPAPGYPCGLPLPGIGMVGPYGTGELLISITPPNPILFVEPPQIWLGPGTPAVFSVPIPNNPSFAGLHFYFQGVIAELSGLYAVTDAVDARVGI